MRVVPGQRPLSAALPQLSCMEGEGRSQLVHILVGRGAVKGQLTLVAALELLDVVLHR